MISRVEFQNIKGRSEAIDLGQGTLIYGPNLAGKTTIVDAIKLAMLGYHPALDKTGRGIMGLASGSPMLAIVTIDKYLVGNEWHQIGDTVRKRTFGPPPGAMPDTPIAALDASAYFAASDRGKVDLVFSVAVLLPTPDFALNTLKTVEAATDNATATELRKLTGGSTDQEWLEGAILVAESRRSESAAAVRRFTGAVQAATVLADQELPMPENLGEMLVGKRDQLEKATTTLGVLNSDKPPVTTVEIDEMRSRLARQKAMIATKDIEIGKALERLAKLLAHDNCPICGTEGAVWRDKAKELSEAEQKTLMDERGQIDREAYHTSEAIKTAVGALETRQKRWEARDRKKRGILEETVAELREEIAGLERKLKQRAEAKAQERKRAEAHEALQRAKEDEHRFKLAKATLLTVKAEMVKRVFAPILETANAFTGGILRAPLAFNDGDLGYWREYDNGTSGTWVSHRTFSGTEQAIAFCGLQAALAAHAPVKLAILDELGRLDHKNKAKLYANVEKALAAGIIEQFIGVDTERPFAPGKFTLIAR